MCGIAGVVNFDGRPVDRGELEALGGSLAHRGPDGEGFFTHANVGLAHRRLAIIDPRLGIQPFSSDDGTLVLSYNGEIYNYVEVREELKRDFAFKTDSDTEVVLHAYEKWGIDCLSRFRGMFAFALYDQGQDTLYLVRDRVGIKPLLYYQTAERLVFASEIQALLRAEGVRRDVAPESFSGFFRYQYVPTPATIYKNLYKLEPGHYLEVSPRRGTVAKRAYWRLEVRSREQTESAWREELDGLLEETIHMYVRADVPFGAFLSGGVDSSLVTALMAKELSHPVRTFTIGFHEEAHSELPFAAEASRAAGTDHAEKIVSPDLAEDLLTRMVVHFGEPFADSSAIPTYYVSREAAREVKMVLSGDGGDELFGGYNSYQTTFRTFRAERKRRGLASEILGLAARHGAGVGLLERVKSRRVDRYQRDHDAQREIFDSEALRSLLAPGLPVVPPLRFQLDVDGPPPDPVTRFQAQDFNTYMVDDVLTKVDRMSMANSLEVRVPLLDYKVVELAFSLPLDMKLRFDDRGGVQTKYLLKKSAARFFPEGFLSRPKQGFGIPVREWCLGFLRPLIESKLGDRQSPVYEWVRYDYVSTLLSQFFAGRHRLVARVWFVLMLDLWARHVHQAR